MEHKDKTILVAWDFSGVADYAMQHAIRFAKVIGSRVSLLHIVEREREIEEAERRLEIVIEDAERKYDFKPEAIVKEGSIFTTITDVANSLEAVFVFMGTHGIKGVQKLTGSWALKVIEGSKMPFIVVQRPPKDEHFENIMFPIDYKKEDKQKVVWAIYLNKYFKSKIYLYVQKATDPALKKNIYSNLVYAKSVLEKNKIEYVQVDDEGKKDFSENVVDYADSINANAILITTLRKLEITDYMFGATEQKIIANKKMISVITVFPKEGKYAGFSSFHNQLL
ncbi:MAG: universal stress protein [Bacteroidales bacterium]